MNRPPASRGRRYGSSPCRLRPERPRSPGRRRDRMKHPLRPARHVRRLHTSHFRFRPSPASCPASAAQPGHHDRQSTRSSSGTRCCARDNGAAGAGDTRPPAQASRACRRHASARRHTQDTRRRPRALSRRSWSRRPSAAGCRRGSGPRLPRPPQRHSSDSGPGASRGSETSRRTLAETSACRTRARNHFSLGSRRASSNKGSFPRTGYD
jgi:hypothetical protein